MVTALVIIGLVILIVAGIVGIAVAIDMMGKGNVLDWFMGMHLCENSIKLIGWAFAALIQAIGEAASS